MSKSLYLFFGLSLITLIGCENFGPEEPMEFELLDGCGSHRAVGGADLRTPRAETEQYYSALRDTPAQIECGFLEPKWPVPARLRRKDGRSIRSSQ